MNNLPLVSVLMTAYNREKYISEAIESVLASTYTHFELIIVDDCSKDDTLVIARNFEAKDKRIKVFTNEKNLGDYPNRNRAASYAKGKYIKYLDADDLIYPWGLQILTETMEKFPFAGYALCSFEQDKKEIYPFELNPYDAYYINYFKQSIFHRAPLSSIIKRDAFEKVGGFTGKQHLGDFELWHILSRSFSIVLLPKGIVWWREHEDQQMNDNRTNPSINLKYLLLSMEMIMSEDCPLNFNQKKEAVRLLNRQISYHIIRTGKNYSFKKMIELKKASSFSSIRIIRSLFSLDAKY